MFFKMIRTQTGDNGTLHAGVVYDASKKDGKLKKEAEQYIAAGFAEKLTKADVDALNKEASKAEETGSVAIKEPTSQSDATQTDKDKATAKADLVKADADKVVVQQ